MYTRSLHIRSSFSFRSECVSLFFVFVRLLLFFSGSCLFGCVRAFIYSDETKQFTIYYFTFGGGGGECIFIYWDVLRGQNENYDDEVL